MGRATLRAAPLSGRTAENSIQDHKSQLNSNKEVPHTLRSRWYARVLKVLVHFPNEDYSSSSKSPECFSTALVFLCSVMSFSAPSSQSTSQANLSRTRSSLLVPFVKCFALCVFSILVLVSVLGSGRHSTSKHLAPGGRFQGVLKVLSNQAGLRVGRTSLKNVKGCSEDMVDYVPCFSVAASLKAGFRGGEEFDRHCDLTRSARDCIVRPPRDYRLPMRWPASSNNVWSSNIRSAGIIQPRIVADENLISFEPSAGDYAWKLESMLALGSNQSFNEMGIRLALDIDSDCGEFSSGALSRQVLTLSISKYQEHGSPVQVALERGFPSMIGAFSRRQLPYPFASFDMIHCKDCKVNWHEKGGVYIFEANRLLRPGGYFILTLSSSNNSAEAAVKRLWPVISRICWNQVAQQDETIVWQKTTKQNCRRSALCERGEKQEADASWNKPLKPCVIETPRNRWHPVQRQHRWPNRLMLSARRLARYGRNASQNFSEDTQGWSARIANCWSLFNPVIFSDHPKRPSDDDPSAPANVVRNVMDMNAEFGGFNAALLAAEKAVWVMNVVPTSAADNTLPVVYDRGLLGTLHDWCQAFPSYPRTYDLLYAASLLSQELRRPDACSTASILLEMDRLLRPEGWVLLQDEAEVVEAARALFIQMRWEARIINIAGHIDQRLLVAQKNWRK